MNADNSTTCIECISSKFLHKGSCVDICPSGYYGLDNICTKCHLACTSCYGGTYKECMECNSTLGYIKISENTCSFPSCIEGNYYNASFLKCTSCPGMCLKCMNSSYCTECVRGYSLNNIGECLNDCQKIGFYSDDSTFECKETCGDGRNMMGTQEMEMDALLNARSKIFINARTGIRHILTSVQRQSLPSSLNLPTTRTFLRFYSFQNPYGLRTH